RRIAGGGATERPSACLRELTDGPPPERSYLIAYSPAARRWQTTRLPRRGQPRCDTVGAGTGNRCSSHHQKARARTDHTDDECHAPRFIAMDRAPCARPRSRLARDPDGYRVEFH